MENARVAVVEDQPAMQRILGKILRLHGHTVVANAFDLPAALDLVDSIANGDMVVDAIVLDGNLRPMREIADDDICGDARRVYARIQQTEVTAAVIGFSSFPMDEYDLDLTADPDKDPDAVAEAINNL